ncbi:unnamed protein product [Phytophthora fragariaefolia]|uniref:Unnamed protein product n=1 Tax=Phytophthora fragariaefolia TaxID=1490495 RepID=A0A9W7CZK0_9STRA|nr:unnamed protein product [Phytophthora fragariaefolia]
MWKLTKQASTRLKTKAPDPEGENPIQVAPSWSDVDLEYAFNQKELHDFLALDPVMLMLELKPIGDLQGPLAPPQMATGKLDAVKSLMLLLKEAGLGPGLQIRRIGMMMTRMMMVDDRIDSVQTFHCTIRSRSTWHNRFDTRSDPGSSGTNFLAQATTPIITVDERCTAKSKRPEDVIIGYARSMQVIGKDWGKLVFYRLVADLRTLIREKFSLKDTSDFGIRGGNYIGSPTTDTTVNRNLHGGTWKAWPASHFFSSQRLNSTVIGGGKQRKGKDNTTLVKNDHPDRLLSELDLKTRRRVKISARVSTTPILSAVSTDPI